MCSLSPLAVFPKNNLSIQKATVPCSRQGNQVRIYNKRFGDFISAHDIHLANNGEINDHVA